MKKNLGALIALMPAILRQVPTAVLVIVGEGPAEADLHEQVRQLQLQDHVRFTGEVVNERVNDYYRMANVFVSTSKSESQGLTYIEAMAADTKVVVAKSPYADDLISDASLGRTVSSDAEFVRTVVDYLCHADHYPDKPELRQHKLHDISATYFIDQIEAFYQDVINRYQAYDEDEE